MAEKAKAAGAAVEVDISALKEGEKVTVEWRGKPVWILKRTKEEVEALAKHDGERYWRGREGKWYFYEGLGARD